MQDREPAVLGPAPLPPRVGKVLERDVVGQPVLDRLGREVGGDGTVGPQLGPPEPVLGRRIAPHPGAGLDPGGVEPGLAHPAEQSPPGVGLGAVGLRHLAVEREPLVEAGVRRVPGHRGVVRVPHGDETAGTRDALHLPQPGDRVREVLEHLVGVDDVEARVLVGQRIQVADLERHVHGPGLERRLAGRLDDPLGTVEPDRLAGQHARREVDRDGARSAPDVKQPGAWRERGEQVGGRVLGRAPPVRTQDALVVAVRVDVVGRPRADAAHAPL